MSWSKPVLSTIKMLILLLLLLASLLSLFLFLLLLIISTEATGSERLWWLVLVGACVGWLALFRLLVLALAQNPLSVLSWRMLTSLLMGMLINSVLAGGMLIDFGLGSLYLLAPTVLVVYLLVVMAFNKATVS